MKAHRSECDSALLVSNGGPGVSTGVQDRATMPAQVNGAESLMRRLDGGRVDTCFTNPGTSEMH
jgi:hypothetical protein